MNRTDRMRVCLAEWAPFHAGAEVAMERLAVGLRDESHEILVLVGTDGESFSRLHELGVPAEFVPMTRTDIRRPWRFPLAQRRIRKVLHTFEPDLIHSNDLPTHQMVSRAARQLKLPRICHHRQEFGGRAIRWFNKFGAEWHLYVSRAVRRQLESEDSTLVAQGGVVLYDGLELPTVPTEETRRESRCRLGLSTEQLLILYAGQIVPRKGVVDLVQAYASLPEQFHTHAELHIVGDDLQHDGFHRRECEAIASASKTGKIRFHGFRRDVPDWLAACDIVAVPSHQEPLGNATLEAMAHARPVIGGNVGGIPEMVLDEKTGLLVNAGDVSGLVAALNRLMENPAERNNFGQAARTRCEQLFSLQAHVQAVADQYQHILTMNSCRHAAVADYALAGDRP